MKRAARHLGPQKGRALLFVAFALTAPALPVALAAQSAVAAPNAVAGGNEAIRPGDAVRLFVWRHEDLSGDFTVNPFGIVALPKLGDVDVSRESLRSLRELVIRELQKTVVAPSIEVTVLKRVRVLGEVHQAGLFWMDPTMTVADALAMAGGSTPEAREGTVALRRDGVTIVADLRIETLVSDTPIRSGDELVVPRRSWVDRNTPALIGGGAALAGLFVALLTRPAS